MSHVFVSPTDGSEHSPWLTYSLHHKESIGLVSMQRPLWLLRYLTSISLELSKDQDLDFFSTIKDTGSNVNERNYQELAPVRFKQVENTGYTTLIPYISIDSEAFNKSLQTGIHMQQKMQQGTIDLELEERQRNASQDISITTPIPRTLEGITAYVGKSFTGIIRDIHQQHPDALFFYQDPSIATAQRGRKVLLGADNEFMPGFEYVTQHPEEFVEDYKTYRKVANRK